MLIACLLGSARASLIASATPVLEPSSFDLCADLERLVEEEAVRLLEEGDSFSFEEVEAFYQSGAYQQLQYLSGKQLSPALCEQFICFKQVLSNSKDREVACSRVLGPRLEKFWMAKRRFDADLADSIKVISQSLASESEESLSFQLKVRMINLLQNDTFYFYDASDLNDFKVALYESDLYRAFINLDPADLPEDPRIMGTFAEISALIEWMRTGNSPLPGPFKIFIALLLNGRVLRDFLESLVHEWEMTRDGYVVAGDKYESEEIEVDTEDEVEFEKNESDLRREDETEFGKVDEVQVRSANVDDFVSAGANELSTVGNVNGDALVNVSNSEANAVTLPESAEQKFGPFGVPSVFFQATGHSKRPVKLPAFTYSFLQSLTLNSASAPLDSDSESSSSSPSTSSTSSKSSKEPHIVNQRPPPRVKPSSIA